MCRLSRQISYVLGLASVTLEPPSASVRLEYCHILLRRYTLSAIVLTLSRSCAFLFVFDSKTFIDVSLKTAFCDPVVYYWLSFSSAAAVTTHS